MIIGFLVSIGLVTPDIATPETRVDFTPPISEVAVFAPPSRVVVRMGEPLPSDNQQVYETDFLAEDDYFGAFAISKDGAYGYVTGANSIAAARDIAINECERHAAYCVIHTEIYPAEFDIAGETRATMSRIVTELYQNVGTRPRNYALAISQDGAYSLSYGYPSQVEADLMAMQDCETYRINDLPGLPDYPCVLIPLP